MRVLFKACIGGSGERAELAIKKHRIKGILGQKAIAIARKGGVKEGGQPPPRNFPHGEKVTKRRTSIAAVLFLQ